MADAMPCYRTKCDLTHPGALSVHMWLEHTGNTGCLSAHREQAIIRGYAAAYKDLWLELLMFGFNPAVMTLGVLNYLPLQELHTQLKGWDLGGFPGWHKCLRRLEYTNPRS